MAGNHISAFMSHMEHYHHSNCSGNGKVNALDTSDLHFFNSLTWKMVMPGYRKIPISGT